MPQYLAPGVYVEEVPSGIKPIAGVGTSTAGFIGIVADNVTMPLLPGRTGTKADGTTPEPNDFYKVVDSELPQLITTWGEFTNAFGDIQSGNKTLAHAVYGFLNNGGTRCWVTRVTEGADADATNGKLVDALDAFVPTDEIAIVAIPGATADSVQTAILDHCESAFLQDRFAILDGRRTTNLTKAAIQGGVRDSSYGAIYFPWIQVFDPDTNDEIFVPPSGHVAGVFARVDSLRGVHKAPANEVLRGALGVETLVSKAGQAGLNPEDINVIRKFDGNITVFGAHTLAGKEDAEWRYVNVRRLFLFLRESIDEGTQWVVFEPNDSGLWAKITRNVTAFLTNVWRAGALFGSTPQEAFYVKCDAETNPPEIRDLGQVVTEVGVAVVKPAEFVIFRISQWAGPGG
jgi:phage tail sheath protein FI